MAEFFESFVYTELKPGVRPDDGTAVVLRENRDKLVAIVDIIVEAHRATIRRRNDLHADGSVTTTKEVSRAEPPMTREEAMEIGSQIVRLWNIVKAVDLPPYCDDVSLLPTGAETAVQVS